MSAVATSVGFGLAGIESREYHASRDLGDSDTIRHDMCRMNELGRAYVRFVFRDIYCNYDFRANTSASI